MRGDESNQSSHKNWSYLVWFLRLSCFFVFAGRGWQHFFGDVPLRTLLWDEELLTSTVSFLFGMSWDQYATSAVVDSSIQSIITAFGYFYFVCAILSLTVRDDRKAEQVVLLCGSVSLTFLAALYWKEKFYQVAQFLEYAAQFASPALLVWVVSRPKEFINKVKFDYCLRVVVGLTFVCHGLYAVGYYAVPGEFIDMTIRLLHVNDANAILALKGFAVLDFLIGASLLTGYAMPVAYGYAAFWGLGTSLARVVSNVTLENISIELPQWLPDFLYRLPHALIPVVAFLWVYKASKPLTGERRFSTPTTEPALISK